MLFLTYFKTLKETITGLSSQKESAEASIVTTEQSLQALTERVQVLQRSVERYQSFDLARCRKSMDEIKKIEVKMQDLRTASKAVSDNIEQLKSNGPAATDQRQILSLQTTWHRKYKEHEGLKQDKLYQEQILNEFDDLFRYAGCSSSDITESTVKDYIARIRLEIQSASEEQEKIRIKLEAQHIALEELTSSITESKQELAMQYRKATHLLLSIATTGVAVTCVLAAVYSSLALYIVVFSSVAVGLTLRQGYSLFQEGKKQDENLTLSLTCLSSR